MTGYRHGHAGSNAAAQSPTYRSWAAMHKRCRDPKSAYAAAGITVCARWTSFENFFADMGPRPEGMSIERENNAQGYEPTNCRWATPLEQTHNRSNTIFVTLDNETLPLALWCARLGLPLKAIYMRTRRGMSAVEALTTPLNQRKT